MYSRIIQVKITLLELREHLKRCVKTKYRQLKNLFRLIIAKSKNFNAPICI